MEWLSEQYGDKKKKWNSVNFENDASEKSYFLMSMSQHEGTGISEVQSTMVQFS